MRAAPPAQVKVERIHWILLPTDSIPNPELRVVDEAGQQLLAVRVADLLPRPSASTELRISIVVEGLLNRMLEETTRLVEESLRAMDH